MVLGIARLKTILIVFWLDCAGAGNGAEGGGGVAARGSGVLTSRGGRRRTVAGSSGTGSGTAGAAAATIASVASVAGAGSTSIGLSSAIRLALAIETLVFEAIGVGGCTVTDDGSSGSLRCFRGL